MMLCISKNQLGDIEYTSPIYAFMDFLDKMEIQSEDNIELLKQMRQDGLIQINLNGGTEFERATIQVTEPGAKYYDFYKSQSKIGFKIPD